MKEVSLLIYILTAFTTALTVVKIEVQV